MKKNIKRYLSYVLGVILAMGLGLSYAYAVGANDSNAFVTTTEWETKVAQIEASLDNVTKTINDTNMDFMLNGPRLQASLFDGFENFGYMVDLNGNAGGRATYCRYDSTSDAVTGNSVGNNNVKIIDLADGRQIVSMCKNVNQSQITYYAMGRYALKTTTPDTYLICTTWRVDNYSWISFERCKLGQGAYPELDTQQTLTVDLDTDIWRVSSGAAPGAIALTNASQWVRTSTPWSYIYSDPAVDTNWVTNTNSRVGTSISGNTVTMTLIFPATYRTLIYKSSSSGLNLFPTNLNGRKYATNAENVCSRPSTATSQTGDYIIQKVYSPYKNCICLKSYLIGEVPIFNE